VKRDLSALQAEPFDVLVVGGGIHGAACARDAAQRGLRTALVERADFGSGVSWNSLKTIHGGLRYLQTLDLRRMRASIAERRALLATAPDLVRPLGFVAPTYGHGRAGREALGLALRLNDLVGFDRNRGLPEAQRLPRGRLLERGELARLVPGLPLHGVSGGALWWDAQVSSSERLLLGLLHAADAAGARLANSCELTGLLRAADGRLRGARLHDHESGAAFEVRASVVLNCAGPQAPAVAALALPAPPPRPLLRAYNLVLGRAVVGPHGVGVRSDGRFLFAVPWNGVAMVGTAYEPDGADQAGAAGFLEDCARAFPWFDLRPGDVRRVHAGLVPGRGGATGLETRTWLRDHAADGAPGLISVQGVKYTTARGVAERAVDLALRALGRAGVRCRTAETRLDRARPLVGGLCASLDEAVRFAVREEQALHLGDVVLRRADLGSSGPPAPAVLEQVARVMATELGWDEARARAERRAYDAEDARLSLPGGVRPAPVR
jgi:glycerol-3-phosphate dehydrogenase